MSRPAGIGRDAQYAVRLILRQPRHALLVIVTMALGIGATTFLFSVAYGVLVKPLPWPRSDRLVVLKETRGGKAPRFGAFTNAVYLSWQERPQTVEGIAAWAQRTATLSGAGEPERIMITAASASLFTLLDAHPLIGRLIHPEDEVASDGDVVVLSESLWRGRFGGDPAAVGASVRMDGRPHTIVGVLPDASDYPDHRARAYVPFHVAPTTGNYLSVFNAIARLRPGATPAQVAAEGTARARTAPDTGMTTMAIFGATEPIEISATPLIDELTADVRPALLILLAAVGLLLAAATGNVASVQLARATMRRRELAIRAALGASSARLMRQLLVENILLGLAGGAAGLYLAWLLYDVVPSVLPADFPRRADLEINATVAAFAALVSLLVSLSSGLLPALAARRQNLVEMLTEDGHIPLGATGRSSTARVRQVIMAGQVAIACVLLVSASLLGRSYLARISADRGYDPSGVLMARLPLPDAAYAPEERHRIVDQILGRLGSMPGLTTAFTSDLPLTPGGSTSAFSLRSPVAGGGNVQVQASPRIVSPGFFAALGLHVVEGRGFTEDDTDASQPVVVVNRSFAKRYLGDSPLGAELPMTVGYQDSQAQATVIGVLDDVRYLTANDSSQPEIYYSHRQLKGRLPIPVVTLLIRTAGSPESVVPELRAAVREANPDLVPDLVTSMEDRIRANVAKPRLYAVLLFGFASFATVIAGVGLFGVLSYSVARRSRELAVRTALGAQQVDLVRLVLGEALAVTAAGSAAGLLGSAALMRLMSSLLYGITPHDAVTYVAVPIFLVLVAALACVVPARRAARLDPLELLRSQG